MRGCFVLVAAAPPNNAATLTGSDLTSGQLERLQLKVPSTSPHASQDESPRLPRQPDSEGSATRLPSRMAEQ